MHCCTTLYLVLILAQLFYLSLQAPTDHTDKYSVIKFGNTNVAKSIENHKVSRNEIGKIYSKPGQEIRHRFGTVTKDAKPPSKSSMNVVVFSRPLAGSSILDILESIRKKSN